MSGDTVTKWIPLSFSHFIAARTFRFIVVFSLSPLITEAKVHFNTKTKGALLGIPEQVICFAHFFSTVCIYSISRLLFMKGDVYDGVAFYRM